MIVIQRGLDKCGTTHLKCAKALALLLNDESRRYKDPAYEYTEKMTDEDRRRQ